MLFRVTSVKPNPIPARAKVQQPPLINNLDDLIVSELRFDIHCEIHILCEILIVKVEVQISNNM